MQKSYTIDLNDIQKVQKFVNICSKSNCIVSVKSDRWTVNGASILGVLSLDLNNPAEVIISGTHEDVNQIANSLYVEHIINIYC